MNARFQVAFLMAALLFTLPPGASAQTRDVTVSFLRGAASSLPDRATVSFDAIYVAEQGLIEPRTWNMRGRGLSRFSVRDPQAPVIFSNLYCNQDSKAFKELVKLDSDRLVRITGYKSDGEGNQASIFATAVEVLAPPATPAGELKPANSKTFRIVLRDTAAGSKTVLANVVTGKTYTVDNLTLTLEAEKDGAATEKADAGTP